MPEQLKIYEQKQAEQRRKFVEWEERMRKKKEREEEMDQGPSEDEDEDGDEEDDEEDVQDTNDEWEVCIAGDRALSVGERVLRRYRAKKPANAPLGADVLHRLVVELNKQEFDHRPEWEAMVGGDDIYADLWLDGT